MLEALKAEVAGRPRVLGTWEVGCGSLRGDDDFEPKNAPKVHLPLIVPEDEAKRLFPCAGKFKGWGGKPSRQLTPEEEQKVLDALSLRIPMKQIARDLQIPLHRVRQLRPLRAADGGAS